MTENWQVTEQDFYQDGIGPGRIIVHLGDGQHLSVLSPDRSAYIASEMRSNPLVQLTHEEIIGAQAGTGTYEVGVIGADGRFVGARLEDEPEQWQGYATTLGYDARTVYANVPAEAINSLVADRGLA